VFRLSSRTSFHKSGNGIDVVPPSGLVEAVAKDKSGVVFSRCSAVPVWTAETLHGSWTLSTLELMAWN
jgi:hypothetical protein